MILKLVKRSVRRIGRRLLAPGNSKGGGSEVASDWYDGVYKHSAVYRQPFYESPYYSTWIVVADRLHRYGARHVLDVGCWGFQQYTGLDFSPQAIEMARAIVPEYTFLVADARSPDAYHDIDYDTVVCTELLEHVEDDFGVLSCFAPGSRCLCTVPNFPYTSHVRHFKAASDVEARYAEFFQSIAVTRLKGTGSKNEQFFLFDGVRNSHMRHNRAEEPMEL